MKNNLGFSSKLRLSFLAPVIIALFLTPVVSATDYGDVSVKIETVSGEFGGHGYAEYRATITNRSATRAHQVTLIIPGHSYSADDTAIREMARTVEVAAYATVTVSLFQPPLPMNGSGMAVRIDGRRQDEIVPLTLAALSMSAGVYYGSGAYEAGLAQGDEIVAVDGHKVADFSDLTIAVFTHKPGEKLKVEFKRGGELKSAEALLKDRRLVEQSSR